MVLTVTFISDDKDGNTNDDNVIVFCTLLAAILKWTGCMDSGVHRQELLAALGAVLQDPDAMNWGAQCNRAIRLVFPLVDMKRKGKYKAYPFFE